MEGDHECYALVWGIMHFKQYLYHNHFTLRTNHKLLEWLAMVSNAYGRACGLIHCKILVSKLFIDGIQDYKLLQAI
jgi:hypothetical protein